ncbi:MAG: hypothetical protein JWN48_1127 [Myxococcaceae bacterium]|nr:hypothetical protein [Myxococcaceae bacterium]
MAPDSRLRISDLFRAAARLTLLLALTAVTLQVSAQVARAELLQAPYGGRPVPIGGSRVACEADVGGWNVDLHGKTVRPPKDVAAVGTVVELKVAANAAACEESEAQVTLVTTDVFPVIDLSTVVFSPDEGRLEVEGARLEGVSLSWKSGDSSGFDSCRDAYAVQGVEHCSWGVAKNASADSAITTFAWYPRGARAESDSAWYDVSGRRVPPEFFALLPSRVVLTRLIPSDAAVDLATGQGEIPLVHPEAVGSAECGQLQCEMVGGKLIVRGSTSLVNSLDVKLRLVPHVFLLRKDQLDTQVATKLQVMHCPMVFASGPPIRNNDDAKVILRLDGRCASNPEKLRFMVRDVPLKVEQILTERDSTYVLLQIGRVGGDTITISAYRGETDSIAVAVAYAALRSPPQVRASLELPDHPNIAFIPNNRWAIVHVSPAGEHQYFSLLPIEGVYLVKEQHAAPSLIRAEQHAAGLTELRFGLRADKLPAGLDQVDLAVVEDPLQRQPAEANIPASIEGNASQKPLVEVLCGGGSVPLQRVDIGVVAYLSYDLRDTCRVVFHRERLSKESGTQKLNLEVDVLRPDGSTRGEAHVAEVVTLRAADEPRYAWIAGITDAFDRIRVRISHVVDEDHYIGAAELKTGEPAAQWAAVLGAGRLRLYGTSAIPTGLYRFTSHDRSSGLLTLNFGVISRLAVLDKEGREFPLAFETGVLVFGVSNSVSVSNNNNLRQVGVVAGLGFAVPIANRGQVSQASINVHAWFEANVTPHAQDRYAFIFGPSISIGNVGTSF